jgi:hypothetical protein
MKENSTCALSTRSLVWHTCIETGKLVHNNGC